jgi:hypothetical protein
MSSQRHEDRRSNATSSPTSASTLSDIRPPISRRAYTMLSPRDFIAETMDRTRVRGSYWGTVVTSLRSLARQCGKTAARGRADLAMARLMRRLSAAGRV